MRMRRVDGHVERKPAAADAAGPIGIAHRPGFLALIVEVPLGLHVARLGKRDGRRFEFALPLALGGDLRRPLRPLRRREQIPVAAVHATMQAVERHEIDVTLAADAVGAEVARLRVG